jgi:diguanylate cyclase (GGDEF)-like protein
MIVDENLRTLQANPALEALVPDVDSILRSESQLFAAALASAESLRFERRYRRRDDQLAWAEVVLRGVAHRDTGSRYVLGTFRDVTESKALASRLVYDATHDALTGLPNRMFFEDALARCIERSRSEAGRRWSLLFLDLDNFKFVNDTGGHHAGDAMLVATAERLRATLRDDDVVCRFAGDEFAAVLPETSNRETEHAALRIIDAIGTPLLFDGVTYTVGASIGIVELGPESTTVDDALRAADAAMYQAKTSGGGRYVVYCPT